LYEYCRDKFDKELIKLAIDKGEYLDCLYEYCNDKFDKELIKLAIDKGKYLNSLYKYCSNKFDKELKNYMMKSRGNKKNGK
jgi:hypothetical protein